ncbi:ABC transporter ATP-binding protein [Streptosporangium lutulentum]
MLTEREARRYSAPKAGIDPDPGKSWMRRALPVLLAHKGIFATSLILSFAGLVLQVQIPSLIQQAIDHSIVAHERPLEGYVWPIIACAVAATLAAFISRWFLLRTAYALEYDLRNIMYERLTLLSASFYDRSQTGQLISRANSDIRALQRYLVFAPAVFVQCGVAFVAFGYMLSIDVPLAFVAMVTTPFVYILAVRMRRVMFPVSWLIQARLADVATIVDENINGARVVKSFAAEQNQLFSLAKAADRVRWGYTKDADLRARWTPSVQNLPRVGLALVLLFGGYMVIQGRIEVGAILAFNSYLLMVQAPFQQLGMVIMLGQRAAASAGRVYDIIDEQPEIVDAPGTPDLVVGSSEIVFDSVDFAYGDGPPVLRDFSMSLRPGETVALVGRTGSGKSTVARLLARFYDVDAGAILIDGQDVRQVSTGSLRRAVGVVFEEPFLFSISVADNIAYGLPDAPRNEIEAAATAAGADRFIRDLEDGYDTVIGERGYTLSGGQRQRVAIARALLPNPPVMILDDATSAIDVDTEQRIHHALHGLLASRTTLVIAHRLSTITLADRVVLLEDGAAVAEGSHEDLMATNPLYREVLDEVTDKEIEDDMADMSGAPRAQEPRRGQIEVRP